jgi:opacity protein-like surface antigen
MRMRLLLPALILGFAGTAAHAAEKGFYLGGGISKAQVDDVFDSGLDLDNTAWKIIAGFRPLDLVSVEASYMDLGDERRSFGPVIANAKAKAFAAHALLFLPIPVPFLGVYGKAGFARWDLDGDVNTNLARFDKNGTEFAWGGGAQFSFSRVTLRLEYDNFDIKNTDGVDLYTVGATWTFL